MNQASSFTSVHSAEGVSVREIHRYRNLDQVEQSRPTSPEEPWPSQSLEWRRYHHLLHFFRQKEKNEQIVRECKEALEKLI